MKSRMLLTAFLLSGLVACAPLPKNDWTRPENTANRVKISKDEFTKVTHFTGPNCAPSSTRDTVFLRAWKGIEGKVSYQVYAANVYPGDWRFYEAAWDSNGKKLDTVPISRKVVQCSAYGGCWHEEHLGINVSRSYLEEAAKQGWGMSFKLLGKAGEVVLSIPAEYIQGFLKVVE